MRSGLREGVQDVGEHQFLMLLLVMQADLEDAAPIFEPSVRRVSIEQPLDRRVDMGAVGGRLVDIRPRDQAALRPRMARAGRDIIGVEQDRRSARRTRDSRARCGRSRNCSKNQVVCARCHLVGLASGIDCTT